MMQSEQNEFFRRLVDGAPAGIVVVDERGIIQFANKAVYEILGYQPDELVSRSVDILVPERVVPNHADHRRGYFAHPSERRMGAGRDLMAVSKSGKHVPVEIGLKPMPSDTGMLVAAFIVNIEDRVLQRRLNERHDRLESVGILAGGLAHDYNNILSGILGNVELLSRLGTWQGGIADRLNTIRRLVSKGSQLARRLMTFSKGDLPIYELVDILPIVRESTETSLAGSNVSATFLFEGDAMPCQADKHQISQAITNLAINAVQAMPAGGHLTITVETVHIRDESPLLLKPGKYGHLAFADDGPGIPSELVPKLFDPFFTTKAHGNGLGLAIVHSIIEKHGGNVDVRSELGAGATFHLYLPLVPDPASAPVEEENSSRVICNDAGRLAVMDDDEDVLETIVGVLRLCGHEVVACSSGEEVVECHRRSMDENRPLIAVILDLMVPGKMGGVEAARVIRERDANTPIIMMSGYTEQNVAQFLNGKIDRFFQKPFDVGDLLAAVEKLPRR